MFASEVLWADSALPVTQSALHATFLSQEPLEPLSCSQVTVFIFPLLSSSLSGGRVQRWPFKSRV